ncbi:MAG: ATP-binding protein [Anaerolineae bacterium]
MSRLWVRLLAGFTLVALVAVGGVALLVNWNIRNLFEVYVHLAMRWRGVALARTLEAYYAAYGSWEGVEDLLAGETSLQQGPGMGMMGRMPRSVGPRMGTAGGAWILADAEGRIVADPAKVARGTSLTALQRTRAIELTVGGRRVGWLVSVVRLSGDSTLEAQFIRSVNRASLLAGLGAIALAAILALLLVRSITAPLRDLTRAAQRLAQGELSHRVPVRGSDEVAEVAQAFNAMAQALQEQVTLRRHLMADIAHELRTPLSVLRGQLEAMLDGVFPLSTENIAVAHAQTLHLGHLVEDLRLLSLAEANGLDLQRVRLDLRDLLRETARAFEPVAEEKGVTLETVLPEEPLVAWGDRQRLRQVLFNLVQNALQFTPAGGRVVLQGWAAASLPPKAASRLAPHLTGGPWQVLAVSDTGKGIPPDELPHLFERFRRGTSRGGTGLGLAIAQRLVLAHGGQVEVDSAVGQGTTFYLLLPAAETDEERPGR